MVVGSALMAVALATGPGQYRAADEPAGPALGLGDLDATIAYLERALRKLRKLRRDARARTGERWAPRPAKRPPAGP